MNPSTPTLIENHAAEVKWIFFDVGQTLLDETAAWTEQFTRLAAHLVKTTGRTVAPGVFERVYLEVCTGFAPRQWLAVVERFARTRGEVEACLALGNGWRHDLEVPYPGVEPTLAALAMKYRLGVIANQSLGTRDRMAKHGLLRHLSLVIGSAEAGVAKPDPRIFERALYEAGCGAHEAVMVGDRLDNDIRPANRLGMWTVHVRQGGSGAQVPRTPDEQPTTSIDEIRGLTPQAVGSLRRSASIPFAPKL